MPPEHDVTKVDEFGLIARLFAPLAARHGGALGLTDDCALFDGPGDYAWAVTSDALVAGVHFLPDDPPELIARKLIRVNLSDLAAMGAAPRFILMACCFPIGVTSDWLDRFAAGLKADCDEFSVALIGGDTVATPGPLTLCLTALGEVPKGAALLRSNARSGDEIWVSGTLGDAAYGLSVAQNRAGALSAPLQADLLARYRIPQPRIALGLHLRGLVGGCMDISDGLVGDLDHICQTSGVGAELMAEDLPLSAAALAAREAGLGAHLALTGGDDYELLFTAAPDQRPALEAIGRRLGLRLSRIGRIMAGQGVRVLDRHGQPLALKSGGYQHFSGGETGS